MLHFHVVRIFLGYKLRPTYDRTMCMCRIQYKTDKNNTKNDLRKRITCHSYGSIDSANGWEIKNNRIQPQTSNGKINRPLSIFMDMCYDVPVLNLAFTCLFVLFFVVGKPFNVYSIMLFRQFAQKCLS